MGDQEIEIARSSGLGVARAVQPFSRDISSMRNMGKGSVHPWKGLPGHFAGLGLIRVIMTS